MLVTIKEYAARIGKAPRTVLQKIHLGHLPAQRIGWEWLIEEDTPYEDYRVKSGKYKNCRKNVKNKDDVWC